MNRPLYRRITLKLSGEALMGDDDLSDFERRLLEEEVASRIELLREEIQEEIRRRLVADRGRDAVARTLRRPLIEDIDLMHRGACRLAEMYFAAGARRLFPVMHKMQPLERPADLDAFRRGRKSEDDITLVIVKVKKKAADPVG